MDITSLRETLRDLDTRADEILQNLEARKTEEKAFHDMYRDEKRKNELSVAEYESMYGQQKYYAVTRKVREYVSHWVESSCKGKIFLDYACGNGGFAVAAAKSGAALSIGLDISNTSVENARDMARREGVQDNSVFVVADCEDTRFPKDCVDVVLCSGMLHHLDLSYALYELRRILRPGGVILAVEALGYNPLIKWYRRVTPHARTQFEAEHILTYKEVDFARYFFDIANVRHWYLASLGGAFLPPVLPLLEHLDNFLLRLPIIRLMSWMFSFEMHSRKPLARDLVAIESNN